MEFSGLLLSSSSITKTMCRTCLAESQTMYKNIQDLVEHDDIKIKLIDILVFLNVVQNNDEENWPQGMCETCVSTALLAYSFKLDCFKANVTLTQLLNMPSSPNNLQQADIDAMINVVYQDHEYDVPLFSNQPVLDFQSSLPESKELTPLPPVSDITSTEQPMRKQSDKKYSCTLCPKSFTRLYGLRYHMEKHAGTRRYLCPQCGKGFVTSGGLSQHQLTHKEVGQFKCGFCKKNYKSRQSLKEHFSNAHSSNKTPFICTICGKCLTAKSTLVAHLKSHNGTNLFACDECPKTYTRASYLKLHKLVHSGQERPKPFSCNYEGCERKFSTKHSLTVHIAHTHSTTRPYKCEVCLKCFATLSGLKDHKDTHSIKDTHCNVCGKQLANKRVLQKHLRLHDVHVDSTDMILETVVDNTFFDDVLLEIP
ncbi:zinc finger protein 32 isoform X1 [Plutella xylostella]|uniref:zinc finger protein 32 isoform X1 n=2 Tax=Plutella xylostella TaxID=51655 RepID=UPI0020326E7C|nr:zinc finger protein 32 isoform X1 [Plutella xylostella]